MNVRTNDKKHTIISIGLSNFLIILIFKDLKKKLSNKSRKCIATVRAYIFNVIKITLKFERVFFFIYRLMA